MTRIWIPTLVACIGLSFAAPAPAQGTAGTGNSWLAVCEDNDSAQQLFCMSYISGVWDGMALQQQWTGSKNFFCVPQGVTVGQVKDIVIKFLRENPQVRHMHGSVLVATAITKAYPCANPQK